jgi:predicted nucleic acid-binding protein
VIILDTNVVSEALKPVTSEAVERWQAAQLVSGLFTTSITEAEILAGIEALPAGKRKRRYSEIADEIFGHDFAGRILAFDHEAARHFVAIAAARIAMGRPISQFDAMIAAIARAHGATLATRNVKDFDHCGIRVVNPWADVH